MAYKPPNLNNLTSLGSGPKNARHLGPAMNKKVQGAKSMSPEMRKWVEANRSKLKDPTDAQKALFDKYDALKKAGNLPSLSGVKSKPAEVAKKLTNKAKTTPPKAKSSPAQPAKKKLETRGKTNATMPSNPAGQRQQRAGVPTRGANVPKDPKLKSKNKQTAKDIVEKYKGGKRATTNANKPSAKKARSNVADIVRRFTQEAYDTTIDYRRKKGKNK